jgi:hypothetical protein
MRSCRTVHLRAPRALWRRPLSADSPSVTTYAGSSNAPNQAASRCVGSSGHDRPPSRSWQVPARRTSHRRAGALRWIDVATEKAPTDRGLKVTKGEAPSRRLLAGRKTHDARFRRFRQFIGTLRGGQAVSFLVRVPITQAARVATFARFHLRKPVVNFWNPALPRLRSG